MGGAVTLLGMSAARTMCAARFPAPFAMAFAGCSDGSVAALALPAALSAEYGVPAWSKEINAQWTDTLLAGMDIGTDDYVLLVLPVEVFYRVKELAETFLQRIARAEEL